MKQFFWKIVICIVPCLLAGWATTAATVKYYRGDSGGFKLGVDLVGGTILVYEIDLRKNIDTENKFDPVKDINVLAESLKRRIDPNDLYNITIRPAGGEGRIEIILPTGGTHRAKKAEQVWNDMLEAMKKEFLSAMPKEEQDKLQVGRGKVLELADRIQTIMSERTWAKKLFSTDAGWDRLKESAKKYWAKIDNDERLKEELDLLPKGNVDEFSKFVMESLANYPEYATTQKTIQGWIKIQAWNETMQLAREKWTFLEPAAKDMERITPDSVDQLTTFIMAKGNVIGQSTLALLHPLVGNNVQRVYADAPSADEVRKFIYEYYGPPVQTITEEINKEMQKSGVGKDLSVEEVQRIKDLVSKVGSLEFRILANKNDDAEGQKDAAKVFDEVGRNPKFAQELDNAAQRGLPPPGPKDADGKQKRYKIPTRGGPSWVTYSWVELGPQERRALNLDNAARTDPQRNFTWQQAKQNRKKAAQFNYSFGSTEQMLQGSLFYSRECTDRNLPEDERRKKEIEYFVLTRDPEFDPTYNAETTEVRTPKIDGSYLTNAQSRQGDDLRPTVAFSFNVTGGNLFRNITRKNVSEDSGPENTKLRRHLAIILDGMVMSAPTINSEIGQQGVISGNFTQKEVDQLVNILRAGRLPATLKPQPVSESTVAATLGEDTIVAGVNSIALGFLAILVFMIIYYRFAGLVAAVALLANLLLTVGFMVAVQATFTLSGLAGLVLTLGMAIDANVLIYERLREERDRGGSVLQALRNGYDRALPTILDSHVTTILTATILYVVGNDNLKGFAVSSIVGLVFSLFTSIVMTRLIFDIWQYKGWLTNLTMMRLFAKPDIDFMSIRTAVFSVAAVLAVLGVALFIARLPNDLNIDFVGGTAYGGKLIKGVRIEEMRVFVSDKNQKRVLAEVEVHQIDNEGRRYSLLFPSGDKQKYIVSLNNIPDFATQAEREENIKKRAMLLKDPSVDVLYNSTDDPEIIAEIKKGESRNFLVRTTEKEPELVQTCLDQLLRDGNGQPLLKKVFAQADEFKTRETRLRFFQDKAGAKPATASVTAVKSLLNREMRRAFEIKDDKTPLPYAFEVDSEGSSDADGKYQVMKVSFEKDLEESQAATVRKAIDETLNSFAARPLPDRLENFDSALATETRFRAMWAILASWTGILLYLWFRFGSWTFGLSAVACVVHDICLTLGIIASCYFIHDTFIGSWLLLEDFRLDLTAVASLLTLVGYSVNDKIVVFDRIREVRGKNPDLTPKMINDSINQTLSRTVLTSMTIAVVFLLYVFGGPGLHLFAFIMMIGVIIGTFSSIYIAAPLLLIFGEGKHEEAAPQGAKQPAPQGAAV